MTTYPWCLHYALIARKVQGCASEFHIYPSIVSPLLSARPLYNAISKPFKPNPTGVLLKDRKQYTQAYLPMGFTTSCLLENSQAAHLNFAYIPDGEYSLMVHYSR